jgi:LmbE family N-acetylglucosaminyl deacetylase
MADVCAVEAGSGRILLVVVAHADDLVLFLGGTIARWADAGWQVVGVRVTDDRWDSVGLTEAETIEVNWAGRRVFSGSPR